MSRPIQRALISVSDKTGIVEFAQFLVDQGVEILSTGGTAKLLEQNGIAVKGVSSFTGFPERPHPRYTVSVQIHAPGNRYLAFVFHREREQQSSSVCCGR